MHTFEWDEDKNAANIAKHGISFEEAITIFEGPVVSAEDYGAYDEIRERSFGLLNGIVVICVIHTDRGQAIRLISARKATKQERKHFDAYLKRATS
ncbi:BrnT family toxin [Mesorhizobium sp. M7A.F.Ce.TU.012.03.2.1]|uniref:BrnT family toxin n=1 Tax=Mesorhizobium sp. M7A.F.Ce.TU.012.03.2.1 TaxID=2493681 RepID=UPI000FDAF7B6|nr:BrnT family toxin [Mesorhizobium sp. M7A.F.Ce.TU.012.03.2.1]AZV18580.1 BrnT family toxin [Mesorhizobium sp. M7A.F.Ce.TU.012.03.2.1]